MADIKCVSMAVLFWSYPHHLIRALLQPQASMGREMPVQGFFFTALIVESTLPCLFLVGIHLNLVHIEWLPLLSTNYVYPLTLVISI